MIFVNIIAFSGLNWIAHRLIKRFCVSVCCNEEIKELQFSNTVSEGKVQLRSRFRPNKHTTKVICCRTDNDYVKAIERIIVPSNRVLIMHAILGNNDVPLNAIKGLTNNIAIFEGKSMYDINEFKSLGQFDVIVVDFADYFGNFLLLDMVSLIKILKSVFEPKVHTIIVKSKGLARHASMYVGIHLFNSSLSINAKQYYQDPIVICTTGVTEYRSTIPFIVKEGDKVLEIGCARGTTIKALSSYIGSTGECIGIDMGKVCIDNARKDHQVLLQSNTQIRFVVGDGWDIPYLLSLCPVFNIIYVDIGGMSGVDGLMEAISYIKLLMCAYNSRDYKLQLRYV